MAIHFTDKEWNDIKSKSSGAYTSNEEELKDKERLEHELDDAEIRKEQKKRDREERKSKREDAKFAKANPDSDFAKQYEKVHAQETKDRAAKKQSQARTKRAVKKVEKEVGKVAGGVHDIIQPGGVPQYSSLSFNIGKSGYKPLNYKPVSEAPYYHPMGSGSYFKPMKVPMVKASKPKRTGRGRKQGNTGFSFF